MINTKCPECSARFYVSEELVAKKVVRFRCRKCGGTITVDGTRSDDGAESASPTEGADDMLLSRYPPAPAAAEGKGAKPGTLRPTGMLGPADDGRPAQLPEQPKAKSISVVGGNGKGKSVEAETEVSKVVELKKPRASEPKLKQDKDKPKDVKSQPVKPANKVADADGEPTTEWTKSSAYDPKDAPPSSKPRLSRVSMDLGSVFEVPKDEEDVEVPMDVEHAPAFEEEIEPEPLSVMPSSIEPVSLDPDTLAPDPVAKPKPPPAPVGAGPKIKPPPPKPRNLDRPSSARVDISAAMSRMDERISDPPNEFFAPVSMPVNILEDPSSAAPAPPSEKPANKQPVLAPAFAVPEPIVRPSAEPDQPSSGRGLYIGLGVVGLALVLGVGYFAMQGDENGAGPVVTGPDPAPIETPSEPARTATVEPTAAVTATPDTTAAAQPEPSTVATATAKPSTDPTSEPTRDTTSSLVAPSGTTTAAPPATTAPTATAPTAAAATTPATTATTPAPPPPGEGGGAPFDKGAAAASIGALKGAAQGCKKPDGPQGNASVSITFAPSGRVTVATVNGPPFAGTPVGGCIAATFRRASVPPFSGSNVTVRTTVPIF
jgi:predicted Zn finger-like uncharacterized protein